MVCVDFMGRAETLKCSTGYNGRSVREIKRVMKVFLDLFWPVSDVRIIPDRCGLATALIAANTTV